MRSVGARASALVPVLAGVVLFTLVGRTPADESNRTITFQARITQDGVPVTADLNLTFQIYTAQSGGAKLWEESHTGVAVRNGILSVRLGDTVSLTNVFNVTTPANSDRWVAVRVGGPTGTEIVVPRIKLTAVPYSMSAAIATIASTLDDGTGTGLTLAGLDTRFGVAAGKSGGQTLVGGTGAGESLTLQGTSDVTSGQVIVLNDMKIEELALLKQRAASPASVTTNYTAVYAKTDGNVYYLPSGGAETLFGSGAGGGVSGDLIVLTEDATTVAMGGTAEADLTTYSLNANALGDDGDTLLIEAWGRYGGDSGDKTIRFYVGTSSINILGSGGDTGSNNDVWSTSIKVTRKSGATANVHVRTHFSATSFKQAFSTSFSVSWSGTNTIKFTGQNSVSGTDAVAQEYLRIWRYDRNGSSGGGSSSTVLPSHSAGRLTLNSTLSVTTTDTTSDTLYLLPHKGDQIALYDGSEWGYHSLSSISASTSTLTAGKNYDVFVYEDSGLKLQLDDWTDDTTRVAETDISRLHGVWTKTNDRTLRYLGTVRTVTSSGVKFRDAKQERFVWNASNRVRVADFGEEGADSWTESGNGTWSAINVSSAAWKHEFVVGLNDAIYEAKTAGLYNAGTDSAYVHVPALDWSSGVPDRSQSSWGMGLSGGGTRSGYTAQRPAPGYHFWQGVETTGNSFTADVYGDNADHSGGGYATVQAGMHSWGWR